MPSLRPLPARGPRLGGVLLAGFVAVSGACDGARPTAPTMPDPDSIPVSGSERTTLARLQDRTDSAAVRIEVDILPGGPPWVAREIELEGDVERGHEEKVESRVVAADPSSATLTLSVGDLTVELAASARTRAEGSGDVTREVFFQRISAALAAGLQPGIELRRPPPAMPQAPNDATFVATDARLDDDAAFGKLELNVDDRHLTLASGDRGTLTLLGVPIALDRARGTDVRERKASGQATAEIQGLVASVDESARSVTLSDGRRIRLVDGTRIENGGGDGRLRTLAAVGSALAEGRWVEVEADVITEGDGIFIATEIEFEIEDNAGDLAGTREFEGSVEAVDPSTGTLRLVGGVSVDVTAATRIDPDGDLTSLEAVAAALADGRAVTAEIHAAQDSGALTGWRALELELETDDD